MKRCCYDLVIGEIIILVAPCSNCCIGIRRIGSSIASYLVGGRVGMDEVVFGIYT